MARPGYSKRKSQASLATQDTEENVEDSGDSGDSSSTRALKALAFVLAIFCVTAVLQLGKAFQHKGHVIAASHAKPRGGGEGKQHGLIIADESPDEPQSQHKQQATTQAPTTTVMRAEQLKQVLEDNAAAEEEVQAGYGSVVGAHKVLQRLTENEPKVESDECEPPRIRIFDRCVCPTGAVWDGTSCEQSNEMYFYAYRAQSDANYVMSNLDMADLPGVMYYLHNEIVKENSSRIAPGLRMNGITRILRFLVIMRPSPELALQNKAFMPFVAFDTGACTVPQCNKLWDHYGFAVGCQKQGASSTGFAYTAGVWFSLPGPCPEQAVGKKDEGCTAKYPGGRCNDVSLASACTYSVHYAGELFLDQLEGIDSYAKFQKQGNREYDPSTDRGIGTSFWNFRSSTAWCTRRILAVPSHTVRSFDSLRRDGFLTDPTKTLTFS